MLRHTVRFSELRLYSAASAKAMPDYAACLNIFWQSDTVVWVSMFHGDLTRKMLRSLLEFFVDNGVVLVKAHRAPGRLLPFFEACDDHFEMKVADAAAYAQKTRRSRASE